MRSHSDGSEFIYEGRSVCTERKNRVEDFTTLWDTRQSLQRLVSRHEERDRVSIRARNVCLLDVPYIYESRV